LSARYQKPALWPGLWQVVNTLVPYAALWYLMVPAGADFVLAGGSAGHYCWRVHRSTVHHFHDMRARFVLSIGQGQMTLWRFITGVLSLPPYRSVDARTCGSHQPPSGDLTAAARGHMDA